MSNGGSLSPSGGVSGGNGGSIVWLVGMVVVLMLAGGLYFGGELLTNIAVGELDHRAIETAVVQLTNAERAKAGLDPLLHSERVSEIARTHSEDMALTGIYAHNINGQGPSDRARMVGYPCGLAENIHKRPRLGFSDAEDMAQKSVEDWMNSPGHKQNILSSNYQRIGVGVFVDEGMADVWVYLTQNFSLC